MTATTPEPWRLTTKAHKKITQNGGTQHSLNHLSDLKVLEKHAAWNKRDRKSMPHEACKTPLTSINTKHEQNIYNINNIHKTTTRTDNTISNGNKGNNCNVCSNKHNINNISNKWAKHLKGRGKPLGSMKEEEQSSSSFNLPNPKEALGTL